MAPPYCEQRAASRDAKRTSSKLYLHQKWTQVLKDEPAPSDAPEKPTSLVVDGANNVFDEDALTFQFTDRRDRIESLVNRPFTMGINIRSKF